MSGRCGAMVRGDGVVKRGPNFVHGHQSPGHTGRMRKPDKWTDGKRRRAGKRIRGLDRKGRRGAGG